MPRRLPLTQNDIEKRERLGFGLVRRAKPVACPHCDVEHPKGKCRDDFVLTDNNRHQAPDYFFDEALNILDITDAEHRTRCAKQLTLICNLCKLIRFTEGQETDARKAEAFQRASRWYKHHERALRLFDKAKELDKSCNKNDAKRLYEKAWSLRQSVPLLPQSLEQEVRRHLQAHEQSWSESLRKCGSFHKQRSRLGRKPGDALRLTFHALQAFAASNGLTWTEGRPPPKLHKFIATVLKAANIKDCDGELAENRSRFLKLLNKPPKSGPKMTSVVNLASDLPETDLERLGNEYYHCDYCGRRTKHRVYETGSWGIAWSCAEH